MPQTANTSITIEPKLMEAFEKYALEAHKSVEDAVAEALGFYIEGWTPTANEDRLLHKQRAAALGLDMEDYIARMIKEWRREEREQEDLNVTRRS